jgi:hypothetical protein
VASGHSNGFLEGYVRPIFQWQYSGVAIPFCWGAGLAMIGVGLALDDPELIHDCFMLAYIFFGSGFIFSIGYWLTSDFVQTLRTKATRARKPNRKKEASIKYYSWQYGGAFAVCVLFGLVMYFGLRIETTRRLSTFSGKLVAADDPFVPACDGATGDEAIIFIGNAAFKFDHWPATILKVNGKERIVVNRHKNGDIELTAEIFSNDGKILSDVAKNAFNVNKNNVFRMERVDNSTLTVVDQNNETALYMRYLNKHELRFDAKLYYRDYGEIRMDQIIQSMCIIRKGESKGGAILSLLRR